MVADGYDPLDPFGKITIKWDLILSSPGHHTVSLLKFSSHLLCCMSFSLYVNIIIQDRDD